MNKNISNECVSTFERIFKRQLYVRLINCHFHFFFFLFFDNAIALSSIVKSTSHRQFDNFESMIKSASFLQTKTLSVIKSTSHLSSIRCFESMIKSTFIFRFFFRFLLRFLFCFFLSFFFFVNDSFEFMIKSTFFFQSKALSVIRSISLHDERFRR